MPLKTIAVVLAAGASRRMGQPKINLAWGETTVLGHILQVLFQGGTDEIVVVKGAAQVQGGIPDPAKPVWWVENQSVESKDMLGSLQTGLLFMQNHLRGGEDASLLVALGDMPGITPSLVGSVIQASRESEKPIIVPSYQMRRGHPWLVRREVAEEILLLDPPSTLRDFLNQHRQQIGYVEVAEPNTLQDIDTPEDYQRLKP